MKNEAGRDIKSLYIGIAAGAGHNTKSAYCTVILFKGKAAAGNRRYPGKPDRYFHKYDVIFGSSKVMDHTGPVNSIGSTCSIFPDTSARI